MWVWSLKTTAALARHPQSTLITSEVGSFLTRHKEKIVHTLSVFETRLTRSYIE